MSYTVGISALIISAMSIASTSIGIKNFRDCKSPDLMEEYKGRYVFLVVSLILSIIAAIGSMALIWAVKTGKDLSFFTANRLSWILTATAVASIIANWYALRSYSECSSPNLSEGHSNHRWLYISMSLSVALLLVMLYNAYRVLEKGEDNLLEVASSSIPAYEQLFNKEQ